MRGWLGGVVWLCVPSYTVEQVKLFLQQLQHMLVCLVAMLQKVDQHHVKALAAAVPAADALLNPLWVAGQVVVDDERAKLQVHALRGSLGGDQDVGVREELVDRRGAAADGR